MFGLPNICRFASPPHRGFAFFGVCAPRGHWAFATEMWVDRISYISMMHPTCGPDSACGQVL